MNRGLESSIVYGSFNMSSIVLRWAPMFTVSYLYRTSSNDDVKLNTLHSVSIGIKYLVQLLEH